MLQMMVMLTISSSSSPQAPVLWVPMLAPQEHLLSLTHPIPLACTRFVFFPHWGSFSFRGLLEQMRHLGA